MSNDQFPSCTKSVIKLFDELIRKDPTAITGATASAKSFNLVLMLLVFHTHGKPMQANAVACNQKPQARAGFENAINANRFYRASLGLGPKPEKEKVLFAMVTGDGIEGGRDLSLVTMFFCTADISKPGAKLGFLVP